MKQQTKALSAGSSDLGLMARTEMLTAINEANNKAKGAWTSMQMDWLGFLTKVQEEDLDIKKVKHDDCLYPAERVDILQWWKENASMQRLKSFI